MSKTLFSVPIAPLGPHPGGSITITEPSPAVYLLTFVSPPDNRLTTPVCKALLAALDLLEFGGHPPGVLITTSGISNFPMPTVALINGHAFAGGLMLAMAHDYRLAPSPKGFICLNEVLFGAHLQPAMASLFRAKLPSNALFRKVALEGHRFTGQEAVDEGIADALAPGGLEDALKFVADRQLLEKPKKGVYGTIKREIYKDLVRELGGAGLEVEEARFKEDTRKEAERREFGKVWVEQWRKENKAKL
ncbi:hypothetical protein MKX08_002683 [Trichoderma sp. CBMAI-0020]|nr:hypothetical protein MKX08_002683 [Trichoderma sp. CBMAI-0020]